MKDKLITLWIEIKERREQILIQRDADKTTMRLGFQFYTLLANEYAGIMDALNTIISQDE
jgi:hypothetical protein